LTQLTKILIYHAVMKTDNFHVKQFFAELLGTFGFALIVLFASLGGFPGYVLAAVYLAVSVYTLSSISGAHLNPAVTLGLFSVHKISAREAIGYITSQFLGAILALVMYALITDKSALPSIFNKGWEQNMSDILRVFLFEAVGAVFFTMGIAAVVWNKVSSSISGVVIGASLFLGLTLATGLAYVSGSYPSYLNPALALTSGYLNMGYILGPVVGAMLGMNLYRYIATNELDVAEVAAPVSPMAKMKK